MMAANHKFNADNKFNLNMYHDGETTTLQIYTLEIQ